MGIFGVSKSKYIDNILFKNEGSMAIFLKGKVNSSEYFLLQKYFKEYMPEYEKEINIVRYSREFLKLTDILVKVYLRGLKKENKDLYNMLIRVGQLADNLNRKTLTNLPEGEVNQHTLRTDFYRVGVGLTNLYDIVLSLLIETNRQNLVYTFLSELEKYLIEDIKDLSEVINLYNNSGQFSPEKYIEVLEYKDKIVQKLYALAESHNIYLLNSKKYLGQNNVRVVAPSNSIESIKLRKALTHMHPKKLEEFKLLEKLRGKGETTLTDLVKNLESDEVIYMYIDNIITSKN